MSDRFYANGPLSLGDVVLDGPEAHHLGHVRRFVAGDRVTLFNGDGREYLAEIAGVGKKQVHLQIIDVADPDRELGFVLHFSSALPKGDRADYLIEKLTELGATDFTPLLTARSIVQPRPSIVDKMQRAVIEASKQSGRNVLMRVHQPCSIEKWCQNEQLPERKWIAHPSGSRPAALAPPTGLAIAVGPEGGFNEEEVGMAREAGFEMLSLGPRILRIETAATVIAAWVGLS